MNLKYIFVKTLESQIQPIQFMEMPGYSLISNASPEDQTQPPDQAYFFSEVTAFKIQINMLYLLLYNHITI